MWFLVMFLDVLTVILPSSLFLYLSPSSSPIKDPHTSPAFRSLEPGSSPALLSVAHPRLPWPLSLSRFL